MSYVLFSTLYCYGCIIPVFKGAEDMLQKQIITYAKFT